jgi:hypothetical protein
MLLHFNTSRAARTRLGSEFAKLLRLNQISCQNPEESVLRAVEFDFPISRPNDRFVGNGIRVAAVRALLTANRTRLVRTPVDVHDVGHLPDYTADTGKNRAFQV